MDDDKLKRLIAASITKPTSISAMSKRLCSGCRRRFLMQLTRGDPHRG